VIVNNYPNINKAYSHLSPQITEHKKKTITFADGNPGPSLGQANTVWLSGCCLIQSQQFLSYISFSEIMMMHAI